MRRRLKVKKDWRAAAASPNIHPGRAIPRRLPT